MFDGFISNPGMPRKWQDAGHPRRLFQVMALALLSCVGMQYVQAESAMPVYEPVAEKYRGTLRLYGSGLKGLVKEWSEAYSRHQPLLRISVNEAGSDAVAGALQFNAADIGISGRELTFNEYLGAIINQAYLPTEYTIASGGYDVPGSSFSLVVFVNKENPIAGMTIGQLDGVFGAERTGGYRLLSFIPHDRTGEDNIRTWGELGLTGEWKDKGISTHGYAYGGMGQFFQNEVFAGGDKWNENYRQYVEDGSRLATDPSVGILNMLAEIEKDKYAIGFAGFPQWDKVKHVTGIRPLALAVREGAPYVAPTRQSMADRTYPLTRSVYIYLNKDPSIPLTPKVKDFVRFVLSEEGQQIVKEHGIYLPLPATLVAEQRRKLD